jgi:hypothetical protein
MTENKLEIRVKIYINYLNNTPVDVNLHYNC